MNTDYKSLLKNPRWFQKRKVILERDNNKCINCGSADGLQVHHRQYHISKKINNFILPLIITQNISYGNKTLIFSRKPKELKQIKLIEIKKNKIALSKIIYCYLRSEVVIDNYIRSF